MGYVHIYIFIIYNFYTYTDYDYTNINKCPADIWWFSQQYAVVFARVTCSGSGEVAWSLQEHGYVLATLGTKIRHMRKCKQQIVGRLESPNYLVVT